MPEMRSFVVGGAGFIGSHLVDRLVARARPGGGPVTIFDDLSVGRREHVEAHLASGAARLVVGDARDAAAVRAAVVGHDVVFHLAANPEARWGLERTRLDLEQGTIATYEVLEAARLAGVPRFVFASSGTVYGATAEPCAEEDLGHLPISLYGASKLACEGLLSAFAECFGLAVFIVRFGNVVGPRGTHGAILDFSKKLRATPDRLEVLGDGSQCKPYLWVEDCADGVLHVLEHANDKTNVYNLAPADTTRVSRIAELCVAASPNPRARIVYGTTPQGWPGDVPVSRLVPDKLARLGFRVKHRSDEAVELAVRAIAREVYGA